MKQLDLKAVWLFLVNLLLRWVSVVVLIGLYLGILSNTRDVGPGDNLSFVSLDWFWLIIPVFLLLCFIWARLTYHFYRYELTEDGFRKEHGVIWKKYVTIPYDRIQNVDIYRGVWARILGLSDLNIQTAGASAMMGRHGAWGVGAEGRLLGLSRSVAEELRDELIRRTKNSRNQGL